MALLTPLDRSAAQSLLDRYGVGVLQALHPLARGSVNSNFRIETDRGPYFLRIFEEQGADGAGYETRLLTHLAAGGVATPAPLPTLGGDGSATFAGKPVALFPWVSGEDLCQARVGPPEAAAVGAALARVHVVGAAFSERRQGRFGADALARRLSAITPSAVPDTPGLLERCAAELERPLPALPAGPIHGDLFRDNVLWDGGRISALLDFESAADGPWAYDLAVTVLAWTYGSRFEPELVTALARGYGAVRPLEEAEIRALPEVLARAACRFCVTRITDFHLRASAAGVVKDYRRFVTRWDAVDEAAAITRSALRERSGA